MLLYMDVHVHGAVTRGLRSRGVDVLTAQEDLADRFPDPKLLDRATQLRRIVFTYDPHFLIEAARRQREGEYFTGIVYAHPLSVTIGSCVDDLEIVTKCAMPDDLANKVLYLPIR